MEFCGPDMLTISYGGDDRVLTENMAINHYLKHNLMMWGTPHFVDCRRAFYKADPTMQANKINSGRVWQHFGLPKPHEADEHNALFDCYSILAGLQHLRKQGKMDIFFDSIAIFAEPEKRPMPESTPRIS